jgi:tetratricopeptide (TPR) repeat protein
VKRACFASALSLAALLLGGCATSARQGVREYYSGNYEGARRIYEAQIREEPQSRTLYVLRLGTLELDEANLDAAREKFVKAAENMESFQATGEAKALIGTESSKEYKGDPYELMMAWWYLGLLDYMHGDLNKALPSFRSAAFAKGGVKEEQYMNYAPAVFLMMARTYQAMGDSGKAEEEYKEAKDVERVPLEGVIEQLRNPANNLLVVVGLGEGPYKYGAGEYNRIAKIGQRHYSERYADVYVDGQSVGRAETVDDMYFQASTRGGRAIEGVLAGKAVLKGASEVGAGVAFATAATARSRRTQENALIVGVALLATSLATRPEADLRSWETLPDKIQMMAAKVAPGRHRVTIRFVGGGAKDFEDVEFAAGRETIIYARSNGGGAWSCPSNNFSNSGL